MKKILTLFVMLLCGWGIVSAQPLFGYQAVVRTADNKLVTKSNVTVAIEVKSASDVLLYSETKSSVTDTLGMLSILVGSTALDTVDWSEANKIVSTVTGTGISTPIVIETPIYPVPYALKAQNAKLTTEQIVNYVGDPATDMADYEAILAATVTNTNGLWQAIRDKVYQYLTEREKKAVEIASYYLAHADAADINDLYNELKTNTDVYNALMNKAKTFAIENKDFGMELLTTYLPSLTKKDVQDVASAFRGKLDTMNTDSKTELYNRMVNVASNHLDLVVNTATYFLQSVNDESEVVGALNVFESSAMKTALVDNLFYAYLDSIIQDGSTTVDPATVGTRVNTKLNGNYLKKDKCGGSTDVDICTMLDWYKTHH